MSTFDKVKNITVEQLSVDPEEVKMDLPSSTIWALTLLTSLN